MTCQGKLVGCPGWCIMPVLVVVTVPLAWAERAGEAQVEAVVVVGAALQGVISEGLTALPVRMLLLQWLRLPV